METIQVKTVDPLSQELLKSAYGRGIKLNWDRFEKLQPQDGFLRLGLSCPFGCLQGPCRIDPFGRGPDRGICGIDRDAMVSALLLRLTLSGALEAMFEAEQVSDPVSAPSLKKAISRAWKNLGGGRISSEEIRRAAAYLHRPMGDADRIITEALRVALLTLGWIAKKPAPAGRKKSLPLTVGYGLLAQKEINIGVCGQPSPGAVRALLGEVNRSLFGRGQIVSLGDFIPVEGRFLSCACTSGEAELVLSSGKINLLVAGTGADPSLIELCRTLNIPSALSPEPKSAKDLVQKVKEKKKFPLPPSFDSPMDLVEEAEVIVASSFLGESFKKGPASNLALLGGSDHLYHPLGWIPTEVAPALQGKGFAVSGWGDAALWMIKKGLATPKKKSPVRVLDSEQGPLLTVKALAASNRLKDIKGVCYTGIKSCQDLAVALGLASLGLRVSVAIPLPLWGSEKVRSLLQEKLGALGGSLTHFDHPAQAEEILDWFLEK